MDSTAPLLGNRYRIEEELGSGGMGVVYTAYDRLLDHPVALKRVLFPRSPLANIGTPVTHETNLALAQEFKILASLRHPHIISVLDYGFTDGNQPYFTMELLAESRDIVSYTQKLDIPAKLQLVIQVLQALTYLHRRGIVHRDLKPANVLVSNNNAKVLDFGLATPFTQTQAEEDEEIAVGTIAYMAPEILRGEPASQASDLYAVGVITYELLTGSRPFESDTFNELLMSILRDTPNLDTIRRISSHEVKLSTQEMAQAGTAPDTSEISSPNLAAILERLLHKDVAVRYADASEVIIDLCQATNIPLPPESVAIRESYLQAATFVGRETELQQLIHALDKTQTRQGSAWLIGGESGVGKSRLADELRTQALVNGFLVLKGQAVSEQSTPYLVWRDILRTLTLNMELTDLEASVLKLIVPDIDRLIGRAVDLPPDLDVQASQGRLLMVIESIFRRQTRPFLVILEDLQWVSSSLSILKRLAQIAPSLPLLLVGTYRDDEKPQLPQDLPDMKPLSLARLTDVEIAKLSTAMLGNEVGQNQNIIGFIQRETEGNIFFIVEVLRVLAEEAGELRDIGSMTLPANVFAEGMRTVIERRLSQIEEADRNLLYTAAVAGRQIDPKILRFHLKQQAQTEHGIVLDQWFNTCQDAAVIEVQDDIWRFTHDKLREALLEELTPAHKKQLNEQVAFALEASYPNDPQYYVKLSYHWQEAGNIEKEQDYAIVAGKQALGVGAYYNAIPLLRRAIKLADLHPLDDFALAELEYLLGEAYVGAGDVAQSYKHNVRALEFLHWKQPTSKGQFLLSFIREGLEQYIHRLTMDRFNRWQKPHANSKRLRLAAMICLRRQQIHYFRNQKIETVYYVMRGLNFAERAGVDSSGEMVQFLVTMSTAFGILGRHKLAQFYAKRADATLVTLNDPKVISWGYEIRGLYESYTTNWAKGEEFLKHCNEVAQESGDLRRWKEGASLLGYVFYYQARWPETLELMQEVYQVATSGEPDIQVRSVAVAALASHALHVNNLERASDYIQEVQSVLDEKYLRTTTVRTYGIKAQVDYRQGNIQDALDASDYAIHLIEEDAPTAYYAIDGYIGSLDVYLSRWEETGETLYKDKAQNTLKYFKKFAKIFAMARPRFTVQQAWYQWLDGQPEKALDGFREAIELGQKHGMPYEEADAYYWLARYLPENSAERKESLQKAIATYERIGAQYELERAQKLLI